MRHDIPKSRAEKLELLKLLEEKQRRVSRNKIATYYPNEGPLRRALYPKHIAALNAGSRFLERGVVAANRTGKTEGIGAFEATCHLTGIYPDWWEGRRFNRPVIVWASGTSNQKTKEIVQEKLLGKISPKEKCGVDGTGMIPGDLIITTKKKATTVPDTLEVAAVTHHDKNGFVDGISYVYFKSYEQGRKAFEGNEVDFIWLDEEPPLDIYGECLIRLMTTGGCILVTFTPLQGLSQVVLMFLPGGQRPEGIPEAGERFCIGITWDEAPHLTEEAKQSLMDALPPHQRDARSKGIPQLGAGAIYPIAEEEIKVDDFPIPLYWPRVYSLDVGWNNTAATWAAWDRDNEIVYIYSIY